MRSQSPTAEQLKRKRDGESRRDTHAGEDKRSEKRGDRQEPELKRTKRETVEESQTDKNKTKVREKERDRDSSGRGDRERNDQRQKERDRTAKALNQEKAAKEHSTLSKEVSVSSLSKEKGQTKEASASRSQERETVTDSASRRSKSVKGALCYLLQEDGLLISCILVAQLKQEEHSISKQTGNTLKDEAKTLKRSADKAMFERRTQEAFALYIEAGLKYLEYCHQLELEATDHNMKNAIYMYNCTAKFFEDILARTHVVRFLVLSIDITCLICWVFTEGPD